MTKLSAILLVALMVTSASLIGQTDVRKPHRSKPNIVYIYADDLGYGELGAYGQQKIKTPNLDRMAREGVRFDQHYSGAPVCAPARAMLMTGKHGGHSYIRGNYELGGFSDDMEAGQMPLPEGTFTIARMLKKAGYATGMIGKWGLGMADTPGSPLRQGFDYYYSVLDQKQAHNFYPTHLWENDKWDKLDNPVIDVHKRLDRTKATDADFLYFKGKVYGPDKMTEKALNFIDKHQRQPFFLYLPYPLPHASLQAPDEYVNKYIGQFNEEPYYGQQNYASTRYPLSTYAAMITYLDAQVGLIMQRVKSLGLDENTIIMFSSDNGATFNTGGVDARFFKSVGNFRGLKMDLYEGGIRIPFLARWKGTIRPNRTSDLISAQYDLMATLAELTGQTIPNPTDGISFLPELKGYASRQVKHKYLYFEYPEKGGQVAIRMGDWKGVRVDVRKNPNAAWQIFNLKTDISETTDVAPQHPDLVKRFDQIQKDEHQPTHIRDWEFINPKFNVPKDQ